MTHSLYGWLKKSPQPAAVLCDEQRIECGTGARSWTELHKTVEALAAEKVTCLDAKGNVLRSMSFVVDAATVQRESAESTELQTFAKLIAEAYEKGTKSYSPLLDSSMQFIERQGQQLAKAEAEIERLRLQNAKLRGELAELSAPQSDDGGVLGGLLAGMAQGQLTADAGATPIGKAKAK
jgi:hypothetical protein